MFQRFNRIVKLSKKDPKAIDALTDEQIDSLPEIGDGSAVFLGEGSQEEWEEQQQEDAGTKSWYDRIKRLGQTGTKDGNGES